MSTTIVERAVVLDGITYRRKVTSWTTIHRTTASHTDYWVREVCLSPRYNEDIFPRIDAAIKEEFGE